MAHNIEIKNGVASFFGTQAAWHKLGQIVDTAQNWEDAMKLAHLDWAVSKQQLLSPINGELVNAYGIFRSDNNDMLGCVGNQYLPIQNKYAFDFVDTLMESDDSCHYVSAGALGNGEKIWCLASINGDTDVTGTGDIHQHYLLFVTSHDGSQAATCKLTTTRVVCQNTLNQALKLNGEYTRIKHTKNADIKLQAAKNMITGAKMKISDLGVKLRELSKRKMNRESMKSIMQRLYGDFEGGKRAENKVLEVLNLFEKNDNNMFPEIRGTAYNLLNAITEHTDHHAGFRMTEGRKGMTTANVRAENAIFGLGSNLKEDALEVIYDITKGNERIAEKVYIPMSSTTGSIILDDIIDTHHN